ncbi:hypothetical protein LG197_26165 [Pseudomonas asiatica]|uniref:hypothetical protein n=1 Tax=Pseudomonas asiatica TaxID=2219225 RepID=UPI0023675E6F|nr:hypothetical protein [Pseudomonas asiatica]WDM88038.1 hypothetical protein LG197_26165 [Pseudomonas asiatica]
MTTEEQLRKVLDEVVRQRDDYKREMQHARDHEQAWKWRYKHDVVELQDEVLRLWDALHAARRRINLDHGFQWESWDDTKTKRAKALLFMLPTRPQTNVPFTHYKDPFHWMRSTNQQWFKELEKLSKDAYLAGGCFPKFAAVERCVP